MQQLNLADDKSKGIIKRQQYLFTGKEDQKFRKGSKEIQRRCCSHHRNPVEEKTQGQQFAN
jgi:hypothetical protein